MPSHIDRLEREGNGATTAGLAIGARLVRRRRLAEGLLSKVSA
jgi:hypothetical protein